MFFGVAGAFTVAGVLVALVWAFVRQSWKDATLDVWRKQWDLQEKRNALESEREKIKHDAWCNFAYSIARERLKKDHPNAMPGSPYSDEYKDAAYRAPLHQLQMEGKEYGIEYVEPDTSDLDKQINELTKQLIRLGAE